MLIFTGDLNLPNIDWAQREFHGGSLADGRQASKLFEFFEVFFMEQMVMQPTRLNNILDLFATNDCELISKIDVEDTPMSDHKLIKIVK